MKVYAIGEFAKLIGVTKQTLRNWDKEGKLKPAIIRPSGHRCYTQEQVDVYFGKTEEVQSDRMVIGYCRVSSIKQRDDLARQIENMQTYLLNQGKPFRIVSDIGSGINYNNKGLNQLIDLVLENQVDKVVVLYKDRLLRFGFELVEKLFERYNVAIEVIDTTPKTDEQELVEDLIQIVTVFSCRLQGKRANKAKKLIAELVGDSDEKSAESEIKANT